MSMSPSDFRRVVAPSSSTVRRGRVAQRSPTPAGRRARLVVRVSPRGSRGRRRRARGRAPGTTGGLHRGSDLLGPSEARRSAFSQVSSSRSDRLRRGGCERVPCRSASQDAQRLGVDGARRHQTVAALEVDDLGGARQLDDHDEVVGDACASLRALAISRGTWYLLGARSGRNAPQMGWRRAEGSETTSATSSPHRGLRVRHALLATAFFVGGCSGRATTASDARDFERDDAARGATGDPCADDDDCRAGLECFRGHPEARPWPGGYCTRPCSSDADCSGGARCAPAFEDASGSALRCLVPCARQAGNRGGCREGYACAYDGLCIAGCVDDAQCVSRDVDPPSGRAPPSPGARCELASGRCILGATPGASHRAPCTSNRECAPSAVCIPPAGCLNVQCDLGGERACPDDSACIPLDVPWGSSTTLCLPRCRPGIDGRGAEGDPCPSGWACHPPERASTPLLDGFCFPALSTPIGRADLSLGSCRTAADCPNPLGFTICDASEGRCVASFCAAPSLAHVPELACPGGGRCVVVHPSEFSIRPSPHEARILALGACLPPEPP